MSRRDSSVKAGVIKVASKTKKDLTTDWIYIPARKPEQLLIVTAGLHGAEGYASSAVLQSFLSETAPRLNRQRLSVLLIHAVNPWGMEVNRRVSENNVDLNRHFDTSPALFALKNKGYRRLEDFLNPKAPANPGSMRNRFFMLVAVGYIIRYGMEPLRQAILRGQYEFPKGLYFGGNKFEEQKQLLEPLFRKYIAPHKFVVMVDLHTGYGARGVMHLFPNPPKNKRIRAQTEKIFNGFKVDWGDQDEFYTTTGDFIGYVGKLAGKRDYVPMVFEFGTMDSQSTTGSIKSLQVTLLENQGFHHGYVNDKAGRKVRRDFREMYYPSSKSWRSEIIRQAKKGFLAALTELGALKSSSN